MADDLHESHPEITFGGGVRHEDDGTQRLIAEVTVTLHLRMPS